MSKTYLANTPLILTDADGTDYRVERGATVVLTDEQFAAVAAHVSPTAQPEAEVPPETPDGEEQKRGKTKDADGAE